MIKHIILTYSLLSLPTLFCMEQVQVATQAQEAREAITSMINGLARLKQLMDEHGIKETIDMLLIDAFPEKLSEFLAKYPIILEILKEARESRQEKTSKKVQVLKAITATPIADLHKNKEIIRAILYLTLGFMLHASITGNITVAKSLATACIIIAIIVVTQACIAIKLPETSQEIGAMKLVNAGLQLMPALPALNKMLKITEQSLDYTVNVQALDSYKRFLDSLTPMQKMHVKNYKLVQATVDPEVLTTEIPFFKVLSNEQMAELYTYFKLSALPESIYFRTFEKMLRADQKIISDPINRFLIAQYNPLVLLHDDLFVSKLDAPQLQYLQNLSLGKAETLATQTSLS